MYSGFYHDLSLHVQSDSLARFGDHLLESLGLHGFPLFLAALAISALILGVSYLIATSGLNSKKKS